MANKKEEGPGTCEGLCKIILGFILRGEKVERERDRQTETDRDRDRDRDRQRHREVKEE